MNGLVMVQMMGGCFYLNLNRRMRNILAGICIIAFAFGLHISWYLFKVLVETQKMSPLPSGLVGEEVYTVNDGFVNAYFIKAGENYIAIDAGNNMKNISRELDKLRINPDKVIAVFLTHSDNDQLRLIHA